MFEVTDFSKFEITEEVEEAKAGEAMQIKTTRRIEIQEDIELASFKVTLNLQPCIYCSMNPIKIRLLEKCPGISLCLLFTALRVWPSRCNQANRVRMLYLQVKHRF